MNERREAKIEILSSCRLKKTLILLEIRRGKGNFPVAGFFDFDYSFVCRL